MCQFNEIKSETESDNRSTLTTETCILVPSWDGYQDLWRPFFHCFFKYWPDCPFPVFLGANQAVYDDSRVKMLVVKPKTDYSSSLIEFLNQLPYTWIIVWVEDLLLQSKVDTNAINRILHWSYAHNVAHVRLLGGRQSLVALAASHFPQADMPDVGMIPKGARYRVGLTVGLWKKNVLINLLRPGESAWDFEHNGSLRSSVIKDPFFCVIGQGHSAPLVNVVNAVRKGLWTQEGIGFLQQEGLSVVIETRRKESQFTSAYLNKAKPFFKLSLFRILYALRYRRSAGK